MNRESKYLPSVNTRRDFLKVSSIFLASGILTNAYAKKMDIEKLFAFKNETKKLHLYSVNSKKIINIEYFENGKYISEGLNEIYKLMGDRRSGEVAAINKNLIESIYDVQTKLNTSQPISIISGYRSLESNMKMAMEHSGVAMDSYHIKGKAVDLCVKGISTGELHGIVSKVHTGGIGYYPSSGFVHMDAGPERAWRG